MSSNPDRIREDIEATRQDLSSNVNALADSVRPSSVAKRQADKVKGGLSDIKDKVMGAVGDDSSPGTNSADGVRSTTGSTGSRVASRTRGNPLAAGLIAFGAGWLVASLLPASQAEQDAAASLKEAAAPLADQAKQAAQEVAAELKEPAQQAVQEVKASASEAANTVKDQAQSSADDVASSTKQAAQEVRQQGGTE